MTNKELRIKINFDANTKELVLTKDHVNKLGKSFNDVDSFANKFLKRLNLFAHVGGIFYGLNKTLGEITRTGIEYNKSIENLTNGLTVLDVATSQNITTTGRIVDIQEKYNIATQNSIKTIGELTKINASTPHTLNQTGEIYKAMYASMKNAGVSTEQMIELTKKLSIVSGGASVEFQQVLAGVDGLATGTVLANSEFGRLLNSLGLTNEVLKNADDKFKVINDRLKDVKAIDSFDVTLSNATNSFSILAGEISKPIFETLKEGLKESTGLLDSLNERLVKYKTEQKSIYETSTIKEATIKANQFADELAEVQRKLRENDGWAFFGLDDRTKQELLQREKYLNFQLENLGKWVNKNAEVAESEENLEAKTTKTTESIQEQQNKWKEYIATLEAADLLIDDVDKSHSALFKNMDGTLADFDELASKALKDSEEAYIKYYEKIGNYSEAWAKKSKELWKEYQPLLGEEKAEELIKVLKNDYLKSFEKETEKSFIKVANEWDNLTSSMGQSIEDNLFNFMKNGFSDFKGLLKNLGNDIISNFTTPLHKGIAGSIAGALVPSYAGGGQTVAGVASSLGLSLVNGQYSGTVNGTNVVLDTMGNVVSGGNALGGISNIASMGNTLYNLPSTIGNIGTFISNPMAGISGLYGNFTGGLYNLGSGISSGLTSLGILGGGATVGSLGGLAGITAGQSLASAGLTGTATFINPATMTPVSTVAGSSAAAAGTTSTLGSSFAAAAPYALGALAAYGLYSIGWGKKTTVPSGFRLNEDISAGDVEGVESWIQTKTKKWGNSKTYNTYKEASTEAINFIDQTLTTLQYASDSLGALGDIEIAKGTYASIDKLTESMGKAFLASVVGIEQYIETEGTRSVREAGEGYMRYVTKTFTETIENPELTQIYQAWQDYAKTMDSTAFEAIQEAIAQITQTQRSFTSWSLRGDSVELAKYQAQIAQQDAEMIANTLGVNFASLTAENFLYKYNRAVRESFDPTVIQQWNSLADAFMNATNAQEQYKNAMLQAQDQQYQMVLKGMQDLYQINAQIDALETQIDLEKKGFTQENLQALKSQRDLVRSILSISQSLEDRLLGANNIDYAYSQALADVQSSMTTENISRLSQVATSRADIIKSMSGSLQDYTFEILKMAGEVNSSVGGQSGLAGVDSEISRVEAGLQTIKPNLQEQLEALKDLKWETVRQTTEYKIALQEMLGANSPIVKAISDSYINAINGVGSLEMPGSITAFADGGIVTRPTVGLLREAGYDEAVIPLKNPNDPLGISSFAAEIKALREEIKELRSSNDYYLGSIARNTKESRIA